MKGPGRATKRLAILLVIGIAVGLLMLLVSSVDAGPYRGATWFESLELKGYDWLTRHFPYRIYQDKDVSPVVIVAVDQESIEQIGPWPWDRSVHARMIDILNREGARVIAVDILFASPKSAEGDLEMAESIENAGSSVVLASSFSGWSSEEYEAVKIYTPLDLFQEAGATSGFTNIPTDPDGVIRRALLAETLGGNEYYSFAVESLSPGARSAPRDVILGEVPEDAGGGMFINFSADFDNGTPVYSFRDVLNGDFPTGAFSRRIVFVGVTGGAKRDAFPTPLSNEEDQTPGVEIQARSTATIETGAFISRAPDISGKLALVLICPLILVLFYLRRLWLSAALALAVVLAYLTISCVAFRTSGLWVPFVTSTIAGAVSMGSGIGYRYFSEVRQEKRLKETFGKYVEPQILQELLEDPKSASIGGRLVNATILFCDIRDFTRIAESIEPVKVVDLLNRFLETVTSVVFKHEGTIDKFIGDEVMVIFGAPIENPDHAIKACEAALEIQRELSGVDWGMGEKLVVGIGINSGDVVVGSIGSERRMEYTAVGDTVNVASRLQSLTREAGVEIMIGAETYEEVAGLVEVEPLEPTLVKGKDKPIRTYVLRGLRPETGGPLEDGP